jgi:predicted glycosyltransferase
MGKRILFHCHSGFGIGHMQRALCLARTLTESCEVSLLYGGVQYTFDSGKVTIISLPRLEYLDTSFEHRNPYGEDAEYVKRKRIQKIISVISDIRPDVFITQDFPIAKHAMAFEIVPALNYIKVNLPNCRVICCAAAFLGTNIKEGAYEGQANELIAKYYDLILVNSDSAIEKIDEKFRIFDDKKVVYTGFIANTTRNPKTPTKVSSDSRLIIVSRGGGREGFELLKTAVESMVVLKEGAYQMMIFPGPLSSDIEMRWLWNHLTKDISLLGFSSYIDYLYKGDLSISMGGYNTCMDIIITGIKSIIYPSLKNLEQKLRAQKLQRNGYCSVIETLSKDVLAGRIVQELDINRKTTPIDTNGIQKSVDSIRNTYL